jgi:hypothetical protein
VQHTRRKSSFVLAVGILPLVLAMFLLVGLHGAGAETGMKALVLGTSVSGGPASREAQSAVGNGFAVTIVDDATWGAMTAAQFSDFQLIIVGDATCSSLRPVVSQNAAALANAVMARGGSTNTKVGNRILIGTDPVFHAVQGGTKLIDTAIDFAGVQEGASGLYLDFTCTDPDYSGNGVPDGQEKLLPLLTQDPAGIWTQNQGPPCGGSVSLIANAAQFSTLTTTDLQGWSCSVHETFPKYPADWSPLAIATDTPTKPTCGSDVDTGAAKCGEAYVLIAGSGIVVEAPNLALDPATATNPVGTPHTVTATVTNPDNSPRGGVTVSFVVTGVNAGATGVCAPATCITAANGKVTYTYTGAAAGDDTINAKITVDGSTQTATAAKTWVVAPTGSVEGKGTYATGKEFGRVSFTVDANADGGTFEGKTGTGDHFKATSIVGFTQAGNTASFHGAGEVDKHGGYTYTVSFVDNGFPGRQDTVDVVIKDSGGAIVLSSHGPQILKTGNVTVSD